MAINGTSGNDSLSGTTGDDIFKLHQGGDDTARGRAGNDVFRMRDSLTALDSINGGTDRDKVMLRGDYSTGLTLGAATMVNVETLRLSGAFDYNLTLDDANVAADARLAINAGPVGGGFGLTFDGSAELDGHFSLYASAGNDDLTGGARADKFLLDLGGVDTAHGGGGKDVFQLGGALTAADSINGGAGNDTLVLGTIVGDDTIIFNATTMTGIDRLILAPGFIHSITTHDANVAAGALLYVNGADAGDGFGGFTFFGGAETDGAFQIVGSNQNDQLAGGAQNDTFDLTLGGLDDADAGGGDDFIYVGATLGGTDIIDGGAGYDRVYLNGEYAGLVLSATNMVNVEVLILLAGHDYDATTDNATVASGERLIVDASALGAADTFGFHGGAETDGGFDVIAGAGEANIIGGANNDTFDLSHAGANDITVDGRGGADTFFFAANFSFTHHGLDGGTGTDALSLDGDYAGTVLSAIAPHGVNGVENVSLVTGHDYAIDIVSDITDGTTLTVDASTLVAGDSLDIDFTASTSSVHQVIGGAGDDIVRMGALRATEFFTGGGGDDTVSFTDMVENMSDTLEFGASMLTGIDRLLAAADVSLDLRTVDANVAAGATLEVDMSALATNDLGWNGLAETNGHFDVTSGSAGGFISGGAMSDTVTMLAHTSEYYISGGGGADDITCNTGLDRILVIVASESTSTGRDTVAGFNANVDKFDLGTFVGSVGGTSHAISAATFDTDMGDALNDFTGASLVTANGGDLIGHVFLVVNADANNSYTPGSDYVFDITGFTGTFDSSDFI